MKFIINAVGKSHDPAIKEATDDYSNRIMNYFPINWNILPPPKKAGNLSDQQLKKKESEVILKTIQEEDFLVALDEKGKQLNSIEFAKFLQERANTGIKNIVFLIGGAYGLDETVLKRADYTLSLSNFTFPHQLVRLILAEQLYRACTIQRNEKYHHS